MLTRAHLEAFLDVVEHRSIQTAARARGRSRATYHRALAELTRELGGVVLMESAPGQRQIELTPAGEELERRARGLVRAWDQGVLALKDAVRGSARVLRVGAVSGSFDLIADVLVELRKEDPALELKIVELPSDQLVSAVTSGEVDLGFGPAPATVPRGLAFEPLGPLDMAVIAPRSMQLPDPVHLADLDDRPLIVLRAGPSRELLEAEFAAHPGRPLILRAVCEVESTPRMVEMVARGFGAALVSRFRLAFVPRGVVVRSLADGPTAPRAGVLTRRGVELGEVHRALIARARARFRAIAGGRSAK